MLKAAFEFTFGQRAAEHYSRVSLNQDYGLLAGRLQNKSPWKYPAWLVGFLI
jgi:hypothetical protein